MPRISCPASVSEQDLLTCSFSGAKCSARILMEPNRREECYGLNLFLELVRS